MKYDYTDLRELILEKFGTFEKFGKEAGYSPANISHRLSGHIRMSQDDVVRWSSVLGIKRNQYGRYFFAKIL